jgi:hypothetical protein
LDCSKWPSWALIDVTCTILQFTFFLVDTVREPRFLGINHTEIDLAILSVRGFDEKLVNKTEGVRTHQAVSFGLIEVKREVARSSDFM